MDSTTSRAHRRVGAAAALAFLALLLLGATRGPAQAGSTVPVATPAAPPTIEPHQSAPVDPDPGFHHDHDRDGRDFDPGFGGGGAPDGGTAPAPAPDSSGGTTT